jgi:hypothetical protein
MEMPEREAQKHERQENEKPLESDHGNSFEDAGIVQHLVSFLKKETKAISAALAHCIFGNKKSRETAKAVLWYLTRAPAGLHIGEDKDAGPAKFHEDVFGNGSGRDTVSGSAVGASTSASAGCHENH